MKIRNPKSKTMPTNQEMIALKAAPRFCVSPATIYDTKEMDATEIA